MADVTVEDGIAVLEAKVQALEQAKPVVDAPVKARGGFSMRALINRLGKHGIFVQREDEDEAAGSGSERWGSDETWAGSHDDEGGPV